MKINEKIKIIRKINNLTQQEFAKKLGISRSNISSIEQGVVTPTPLLINCLCLMFDVKKEWLIDDTNDDLSGLKNSNDLNLLIADNYEKLNDTFKKFIENQINELLNIQNKKD